MKNELLTLACSGIPRIRLWVVFICVLVFNPLRGQENKTLVLGTLFQDHMVLQRGKPIKIWGTAAPGTGVKVSMNGQNTVVRAEPSGKWAVQLPPLLDKGPYTIEITSEELKVELNDVLVGDVWIASGQSNMEWPVRNTLYKETDTNWVKSADIRFIKILPEMDYMPREESRNTGWKTISPSSIENLSAVAYHFGKYVHNQTGVPIGLISANLGATAIETWMSNESLSEFPQFKINRSKSFAELEKAFEQDPVTWSRDLYYSGRGLEEEWFTLSQEDSDKWKPVTAAFNTWEKVEDLKNFDGAVWFRKKFDLPEGFSGDSLDIQLLQIDNYDITWVNGKKIGATFGNHNHRNYKVAVENLKEKGNLLVVRVYDTGGIGGFTTNSFWGNEILWGTWEYRKGTPLDPSEFVWPELPNASPFSSPGVLFNGTIAPLTNLGIKGIIWYQGESNELRAYEYRKLFPALIEDWRRQFGQGKFPFLFVQLANYRQEPSVPGPSLWAELRESQALALRNSNTGMAVAIDLGEAGNIHPENKEDVGKRLGKLALNLAYGRDVLAKSPQYHSLKVEGNMAILNFRFIGKNWINRNKYEYIRGFQIAGPDRKFYWAKARLDGKEVRVWSHKVKNPVAVRYAWSDNPGPLDLYNAAGLPLAPFRTDGWKLETEDVVFEKGAKF